jgi:hypothetical protein
MGLFNGPPATDAQRDLVAMTDARTREWYLEAEITMLNMRIAELEAALKPFTIELLPSHNVYGCEMVFVKPEEIAAARKVLGDR